MFVKSIETFPALAVNEVLLYFNSPSRLASRLSVSPLAVVPPEDEEEEGEEGEDEVAGDVTGLAGVELDDELLLEELLPQPATASSATSATLSATVPRTSFPPGLSVDVALIIVRPPLSSLPHVPPRHPVRIIARSHARAFSMRERSRCQTPSV